MSWVIATMKVQAGKEAEFESIMNALVDQVRSLEPNVLHYELTKNKRDASEYVMLEHYASDDAFKAHMKSAHFQEAFPKFMACLTGAPEGKTLLAVDR